MVLTIDRESFYETDLTELSRKTLQTNVLEYQLRSLFVKGGYAPGEIGVSFSIPENGTKGYKITIYGPVYQEMESEDQYGKFVSEWREFYRNYLIGPYRINFINTLSQTRFVTFNPISIYYQLLLEEQKSIMGVEDLKNGVLQMRRTKVTFKPKRKGIPIVQKKGADIREIPRKEEPETEFYLRTQREYDGHFAVERLDEEKDRTGMSSWAEGYVDDGVPVHITKIDPQLDVPNGGIFNMFSSYPFYAFPVHNVYKKIEDINRMIESGLGVVFMNEVSGMDFRRVKETHLDFFRSWGIDVIDYVSIDRLRMSGLKNLIPSDKVLPGFFVIKRPVEKFHFSAWTGLNTVRRRGLPGIPWAMDEMNGSLLLDPQPDDGFLNYFVREGIERKLAGKHFMEVNFPVCTIHTPSEVYKLILEPLEEVFKRSIEWRVVGGVGEVRLRNMGEWILLRGMMRRYL